CSSPSEKPSASSCRTRSSRRARAGSPSTPSSRPAASSCEASIRLALDCYHPPAAAADLGDVASARRLGPPVGGSQLDAPEHGGEHGLHPHHCEGGSDASSRPAAEGDEDVWRWRAIEEALRPESATPRAGPDAGRSSPGRRLNSHPAVEGRRSCDGSALTLGGALRAQIALRRLACGR